MWTAWINSAATDRHILSGVTTPVDQLLRVLDLQLDQAGEDATTWIGATGKVTLNLSKRLFGGIVAAQALVAAGRSFEDRSVHSIQQVFLRAGDGMQPVRYRVEPLFAGRTFASARVEAHQDGQIISHAQVGLSGLIEGPSHQEPAPELAPVSQMVNRDKHRDRPDWDNLPIEMYFDADKYGGSEPEMATWIRPTGPLPDDALIHQAVLAYASDRALMTVAWRPLGSPGSFRGSTLDHSIWFHRPLHFDEWHSYVMQGPTAAHGRSLSHGTIHDVNGVHVASTVQQGTFRPT